MVQRGGADKSFRMCTVSDRELFVNFQEKRDKRHIFRYNRGQYDFY